MCRFAASPRDVTRDVMITLAPSVAKCTAEANPMPEVAPTMRTVCPSKVPAGGNGAGTKRPTTRCRGASSNMSWGLSIVGRIDGSKLEGLLGRKERKVLS
jgi:hypothetical protein